MKNITENGAALNRSITLFENGQNMIFVKNGKVYFLKDNCIEPVITPRNDIYYMSDNGIHYFAYGNCATEIDETDFTIRRHSYQSRFKLHDINVICFNNSIYNLDDNCWIIKPSNNIAKIRIAAKDYDNSSCQLQMIIAETKDSELIVYDYSGKVIIEPAKVSMKKVMSHFLIVQNKDDFDGVIGKNGWILKPNNLKCVPLPNDSEMYNSPYIFKKKNNDAIYGFINKESEVYVFFDKPFDEIQHIRCKIWEKYKTDMKYATFFHRRSDEQTIFFPIDGGNARSIKGRVIEYIEPSVITKTSQGLGAYNEERIKIKHSTEFKNIAFTKIDGLDYFSIKFSDGSFQYWDTNSNEPFDYKSFLDSKSNQKASAKKEITLAQAFEMIMFIEGNNLSLEDASKKFGMSTRMISNVLSKIYEQVNIPEVDLIRRREKLWQLAYNGLIRKVMNYLKDNSPGSLQEIREKTGVSEEFLCKYLPNIKSINPKLSQKISLLLSDNKGFDF